VAADIPNLPPRDSRRLEKAVDAFLGWQGAAVRHDSLRPTRRRFSLNRKLVRGKTAELVFRSRVGNDSCVSSDACRDRRRDAAEAKHGTTF
jgi:hypothetical protein